MALPQPFSTTRERVATFDYLDLADNSGVVKYLAFADTDSVGTDYGLLKTAVFGNPTIAQGNTAGAPVTVLDVDFDLEFNTPRTLNGDVVANIPMAAKSNALNGANMQCVLTIYRVRGGVPTSLGTMNYIV